MTPSAGTTRSEPALLGIYLNDHLAGATAGLELARRSASAHQDSPAGKQLEELVEEIAQDRESLRGIMTALGVPQRQYKVYAAWAAERVGRLKLNGHLFGRSPLSSLVELEGLRLGVEGKASLWRTLRSVADHDSRLDAAALDALLARARGQVETLEEMRVRTADQIFGAA
jgi:hypothetical protein